LALAKESKAAFLLLQDDRRLGRRGQPGVASGKESHETDDAEKTYNSHQTLESGVKRPPAKMGTVIAV
jgi:hypothetical protein